MFIAFVVVLGVTFGEAWDEVGGMGVFMLGLIVVGVFILKIKKSTEEEDKKRHHAKREEIEDENEKFKKAHKNQIEEYNKLKKRNEEDELKYQKALKNYEEELSNIKTPSYIKNYKEQLFNNFISEIKFKHCTTTNVKKGVSEKLFLKRLSARFKENIGTPYSINSDYDFTPDFTYYNEKLGFFIDIEIDEPYVGETGKPIHFLYQDGNRDSRFTSNGWIVVRFAEEQVVRFPYKCCDVIERIVTAMKSKTVPNMSIPAKLKQVQQWTKEEAQQMAIGRYRNTYLNITFNETDNYEENVYYEPPIYNDEFLDYDDSHEGEGYDEDYERGR
jgi:hypothetical protein